MGQAAVRDDHSTGGAHLDGAAGGRLESHEFHAGRGWNSGEALVQHGFFVFLWLKDGMSQGGKVGKRMF